MRLTEIFDTTELQVDWNGDHAMFRLGNFNYIIQCIHISENDQIHRPVSQFPITDHTYFFAFAAQPLQGGYPIDTDTEARDSIKVFSIVLQELQKFVDKKKVDMLYFGCDADHQKRRRLYQKMVNKYTASSEWQLIGEADANYFNEVKHLWIVQRS